MARSVPGAIGRSGRQQDQLRGLTAIQRQIDRALPVDDLRYRLIFGLHHRGGGRYLHRLRDAADLQFHVNAQLVAHLDHDSRLVVGAEASGRHLEGVGSYRQAGQVVTTVIAAGHGAVESGFLLHHLNRSSGHDGSVRVRNRALNLPAPDSLCLQELISWRQKEKEQE